MHYSSKKNINAKNYNRLNANQILKEKISNLPILANDTDNVIEGEFTEHRPANNRLNKR